MDTIFALASGRGRAGVAVIRLSGPQSHAVVAELCGVLPPPRIAGLRKLCWRGDQLDEALVLTFEKGASFTGEQAAELQIHGGQAVIAAVLGALGSFDGMRLAEPGEFTRRALENGNLALFEVEGLVDLIDAETEGQRRQAQRLIQGDFARKVAEWREELLTATALIEATIDFADEDVPVDVWPDVVGHLYGLLTSLEADLQGAQAAERMRSGFEVVVYGPPNVGKSSIINALTGKEAAMTSEIAGTTRDMIEVRLDIGGLPVVLIDTAGLRETDDPLESEGVRRARRRATEADVKILVRDQAHIGWNDDGLEPDIIVSSKADLDAGGAGKLAVSVVTGVGLDQLRAEIDARLVRIAGVAGVVVNARHRAAVERAVGAVRRALDVIAAGADAEIAAMDLRAARISLEGLVGRIGTEDVLGAIFGRFCIGK
ncbi:MAG: tRNA uridine-5-carboxymethylaminomethyl(34) synthesis GTPase MnmE [Paracoccaceae bacterium]